MLSSASTPWSSSEKGSWVSPWSRWLPAVDVGFNAKERKWQIQLINWSNFRNLGPVVRSLVSADRWLRGIKTYRFLWYLTLVSANHASSKPGQQQPWFDYTVFSHPLKRVHSVPSFECYLCHRKQQRHKLRMRLAEKVCAVRTLRQSLPWLGDGGIIIQQ